jgi:hypothetical protein
MCTCIVRILDIPPLTTDSTDEYSSIYNTYVYMYCMYTDKFINVSVLCLYTDKFINISVLCLMRDGISSIHTIHIHIYVYLAYTQYIYTYMYTHKARHILSPIPLTLSIAAPIPPSSSPSPLRHRSIGCCRYETLGVRICERRIYEYMYMIK